MLISARASRLHLSLVHLDRNVSDLHMTDQIQVSGQYLSSVLPHHHRVVKVGFHGQHTFVIPSLDMVVTRSGEQPPDAVPGATKGDPDAVIAGAQKEGYHELFRMLMDAVTDMPDSVRNSIANPGPYRGRGPELNLDPDPFLFPVDAIPAPICRSAQGRPRAATRSNAKVRATTGPRGGRPMSPEPCRVSSAQRSARTASSADQGLA